MHDLHMIHTDLKPENILLVSSDYVKVPDYKVMLSFLPCYLCCALAMLYGFHVAFALSLSTQYGWIGFLRPLTYVALSRTRLALQRTVPTIKEPQNQVPSRWLILVALPMSVKIRITLYQHDITGHQKLFLVILLLFVLFL